VNSDATNHDDVNYHGALLRSVGTRVAVAVIGSLVIAACASVPTPTPAPTTRAECALVVQVHQARERVLTAVDVAKQGQNAAAARAASETRAMTDAVSKALGALGRGEGAEKVLRDALTFATIDVSQFAELFIHLDELSTPASAVEAAQEAERNRLIFDEQIGTLDAIAVHGSSAGPGLCPDLALAGLPTLPPPPTAPPAGPSPSGSAAEQRAAALAALGLRAAAGVELSAPAQVGWLPAGSFYVRDLKLANRTNAAIRYPFEPTVARWSGQKWDALPCPAEPDVEANIGALCAVQNTNTNVLAAGTTASDDTASLGFSWPGSAGADPGTYALVVPIWRGGDDFPTAAPAEGAVAILSVVPGS
jgi:hypothetical protein